MVRVRVRVRSSVVLWSGRVGGRVGVRVRVWFGLGLGLGLGVCVRLGLG